MTDVWKGNADIVGGNLAEYLSPTPLSERKLSKRLREVERFEARISDELSKNQPCGGAVRRDLLEMELAALKRDRVSIEEKLLRVVLFDPLMNFQVTPILGSERDTGAGRGSGSSSITIVENTVDPHGVGYSGRTPPVAVNRPATSDSVCGRYTAYSGEESGGGVWSSPISFGVLNDKTIEATAVEGQIEGIPGAKAQEAVGIKRRRLMDDAISRYSSAAPSSCRGGGDLRSHIDSADRDGVDNMVSWQSENCEMLRFSSTSPRPPRTHWDSRQWVAPPFAPVNTKLPSYHTFDALEPCARSPGDLNDVSGNEGPFHVPTVLPSESTIYSNNLHGTPTQSCGNYFPPHQSPTPEDWTACNHDWQLDGVRTDDLGRVGWRGQPFSKRYSVPMTGGDWQQRVGHNRHVQTGGWSEEAPITASAHVKRWRRRTMSVAIPIDARQGERATSNLYHGRNRDFPKCSAWDTGFYQQNIPQQPGPRERHSGKAGEKLRVSFP